MTISKIHESVEWSKRQLEKNCKERKDAVAQFVGFHYSEHGANRTVPVNMLELAVTIYLRLLAANEPRCVVSTDNFALKPFAADLEIVLNQLPKEIGMLNTIRRTVLEAMFSIGVVKIGIAGTDPNPHIGDDPFVSVVQMDDYFVDMSARSWDEIQYEGNEYWMSTDEVERVFGINIPGDNYHGDSTEGVNQANSVASIETRQPLYDKILIRDVYLPRDNEMITYAVNLQRELRRVKWDGPEGTPYLKLWFEDVPGNLMPLSPVNVWKDLHILGNQLFRKLANQGVSKKTVAVFQGGDDEEIARFNNAKDGDAIRYNGVKPEDVTVGGVDSGNLAFFLNVWDRFSMICGNLDSLGGLSPQSQTAAQDKLISEAASARVKDMGDRVVQFVKTVFERLAWYVWTDPVRTRKYVKYASKEMNIGIQKEWTPETRDGNFLDYNFDIAVFSMQDDSPSARIQKMSNVFNTFIAPMLPQLQQQGAFIDARAMTDYLARNANLPELNDWVKFSGGDDNQARAQREFGGNPQPEYVSTKAPVTHRIYERVNRPGATRSGRDAAMMQTLLGGNAQAAEMAALAPGRAI